MGEFKREERFIVVKLKTLDAYQKRCMRDFLSAMGIRTCECVVVESDWPEYEQVWEMIAARVEGRPTPYQLLEQQVAALRQHKTDYMEAAEGTRRALEAEAQALREEVAALRARVVVVHEPVTMDGKTTIREYVANAAPADLPMDAWTQGYEECKRRIHAMFEQPCNKRLNGKAVSEGLLRRLAECGDDFGEAWEELRALLNH